MLAAILATLVSVVATDLLGLLGPGLTVYARRMASDDHLVLIWSPDVLAVTERRGTRFTRVLRPTGVGGTYEEAVR